jgi:hypothetical protein
MEKSVDQQLKELNPTAADLSKKDFTKCVYFEGGRMETPVFRLESLEVGDKIQGPAILADGTQTIVVAPEATALILYTHVVINIGEMEGDGQKKLERTRWIQSCSASLRTDSWPSQSRWGERCRRPASAPTSKRDWTTPVPCLMPMEDWLQTVRPPRSRTASVSC